MLYHSPANPKLILHIPFIQSLRLRTLLLLPPSPSHPNRPSRLRLYANLPTCPDFADVEALTPIMDLDVSSPPAVQRGVGGVRDVEEWGLKVQKLASVHSVTLFFVSLTLPNLSTWNPLCALPVGEVALRGQALMSDRGGWGKSQYDVVCRIQRRSKE